MSMGLVVVKVFTGAVVAIHNRVEQSHHRATPFGLGYSPSWLQSLGERPNEEMLQECGIDVPVLDSVIVVARHWTVRVILWVEDKDGSDAVKPFHCLLIQAMDLGFGFTLQRVMYEKQIKE